MVERLGAAVVVWRQGPVGPEFLLLHRTGADDAGPWCWTYPSGGCRSDESLMECASRELTEETGLVCDIEPIADPGGYPVFLAQVAPDVDVQLLDGEHDRFDWVSLDRAVQLIQPKRVADSLVAAAIGIG